MRRTALLAGSVFMAYLVWGAGETTMIRGGHAGRGEAEDSFVRVFLRPVLGEFSRCVKVSQGDDGWLELLYMPDAGCDKEKVHNQLLTNLASKGTHRFRQVRPGSYLLAGAKVPVGSMPAYSPAYTQCLGSDSWTLLLDPSGGLGMLPGGQMSDHFDIEIDAGQMFVHETGHGAACPTNDAHSKELSLISENWYLYQKRWKRKADKPLRIFHDPVP